MQIEETGDQSEMRTGAVLLVLTAIFLFTARSSGQEMLGDVEGLSLTEVSPSSVRLSWTAIEPLKCEFDVTYSVYRDTKETFTPSRTNRIASGLTRPSYLAHEPPSPEPTASVDFYYHVRAVKVPSYCTLTSGTITVYPIDLGQAYRVTVGEDTHTCNAVSTSEIDCPKSPGFHAVIASQGGHEFLIGCLSTDYEYGDWTCVNLTTGTWRVNVHSQSITVLTNAFYRENTNTAKRLGAITPVFSILGVLK
jgi:hypothetical protein